MWKREISGSKVRRIRRTWEPLPFCSSPRTVRHTEWRMRAHCYVKPNILSLYISQDVYPLTPKPICVIPLIDSLALWAVGVGKRIRNARPHRSRREMNDQLASEIDRTCTNFFECGHNCHFHSDDLCCFRIVSLNTGFMISSSVMVFDTRGRFSLCASVSRWGHFRDRPLTCSDLMTKCAGTFHKSIL